MKDFENWMYEFACNGKNEAQNGNNIIDNKAMSIINFSSLLIPITVGILFFILENIKYPMFVKILLTGSIGLFLLTIISGFAVLWLRNPGIIPIKEHFNAIDKMIEYRLDIVHESPLNVGYTCVVCYTIAKDRGGPLIDSIVIYRFWSAGNLSRAPFLSAPFGVEHHFLPHA